MNLSCTFMLPCVFLERCCGLVVFPGPLDPGPLDPGARSILARSFPVVSRLHAGVKGVSLPHQRRFKDVHGRP